MGFELSLLGNGFNQALIQKQAVNEVMKYNDLTAKYGLVLTEKQATALVETRAQSLIKTGRIEFGGGIIDKIIFEFCDSPYIASSNYEEVLHELIEIFYYYKSETLDMLSDSELIEYMRKAFNGVCQGSLDLLFSRELDDLARNLRSGCPVDSNSKADYTKKEDENGDA